ncbi:putative LAGLIDADG endonuclease, partial (mitochondrion) [Candida oxycetoniae]
WLVAASPYSDIRNKINFAICWNDLKQYSTLKCKNLYCYIQSAGNLSLDLLPRKLICKYIQSASETTREISFNLYDFHKYNQILTNKNDLLYKNINSIPDDFLIWLIGFIEGDGAIQTYSDKFKFVLTQKESNVLYLIQNILGIGKVVHYPQGKYNNKNDFYRLIVTKNSHILLLTYLLNGNLAINSRINQLSHWINLLNIKSIIKLNNKNIKLINKPVDISLNDPWLSGFTDAEGCFNISIENNRRYSSNQRIKLRYLLDQKDEIILNKIKNLFSLGKVTLRNNTNGVYRYTITGLKGNYKIISYFNKYPLYTKKSISYNSYNKVYNMLINKEHLTEEGLMKIRRIKTNMSINNSLTTKTGRKSYKLKDKDIVRYFYFK